MLLLKQSTAATIKMGPFVDDTDGKTAEAGLSISQSDIRLSKNGEAFAQTNNVAGATHDENGYYDVPLNTTDTDTLGRLKIAVSKSGALPVWQDFIVLPDAVFTSLVTGTTSLTAKLAADGLDALPTTLPTGPATTVLEKINQLWARFFNKATATTTALKTYTDDGNINTTQTITFDGTTKTVNAAS